MTHELHRRQLRLRFLSEICYV